MKIAYLVNQYPKLSHSFIRREISGVEASGLYVLRCSIRAGIDLVEEADRVEEEKTRVVLGIGKLKLLGAVLGVATTRPIRFAKALWLALKTSRGADRSLFHHLAYLMEACVLLGWFLKFDISHTHAHFGTNSTTVVMLCRVLGGPPYSFTVHGPEEFDRVKSISLEEKIKRSAFVVAVSSFGKSQLCRWCERDQWSKIHVIHCGVDDLFLNAPRTPVPDTPRLVCVGRLCEQKGQLLLVEACKQLAASGVRFNLVLVGDGPLRSDIELRIAQLGLQDFIEITGHATSLQVQQHILAARAMVLPSFAEGLPVVIMEALALGRPVLSTFVAGIPELVEPQVSGWLVPAGSVQALAEGMARVLETPVAVLEQMGQAGAARVAQQHSAAMEAGKLAGIFRSTMSTNGYSIGDRSGESVSGGMAGAKSN